MFTNHSTYIVYSLLLSVATVVGGTVAKASDPVVVPAPAASAVAPVERHLWAYPDGVIISAGSVKGKLARHKVFRPESDGLVTTLTYVLRVCAVQERNARPEWRKSGAKFVLSVAYGVDKDGKVNGLMTTVKPALAAPKCFDKMREMARAARFTAGATDKPVKGSLGFEVVVLTDEEAQGRGYHYYAAEREFERRMRQNKHWFACEKDAECTIVTTKCMTRGVNLKYAEAFQGAIAERPAASCRGEAASERTVRCANKACTLSKPR